MVKGISRQVIVMQSPEPKLFEQAIFILNEDAMGQEGITDEKLLQEAKRLLRAEPKQKKIPMYYFGPAWACGGALVTGLVWLVTILL